ncbi:Flp pilus assembly protein CpaB [Acetobacterium wieringae]|uniref:Flp pilus assembly protein CpaB n=1 Tax=Acetobacterium wieringae TaxID=52694 RepID=A0ABY6HJ18_9FIRM|nr:Flp pilus assembly protein CpaB [Acetobacterium wieringae]UYO64413.1 Flp pilus assembly protein CpaB [Acetobacterium wieringae]VUZ25211.1 Uncharacterised protein [Acetobacterium wieringae]
MSRKKKTNKQTLVGILALVLSGLIIFIVVPVVTGLMGNTTEVVRVSKMIAVGDKISEENTEVVEVSSYNLPSNLIKNKDDALGKYVTARLEPGDYILESKTVNNMVSSGNYMSVLDGDKRIVSVTIKDLASGISGKLQSGDIVSVLNNAESTNGRGVSYKELKYVKVLAVTSGAGVDGGGDSVASEDKLPATVTLLCNENQAQLLAGLEKNGNIYFSLVYRGDMNVANEFLQTQDKYFTNNGNI